MSSSEKDNCTICTDDINSNEAVSWCTECEVFLCKDCEKHHRKSGISETHKTISTYEYDNLPDFLKTISIQCREHKKKLELYCSVHVCPCCIQCFTDKHQKCQDMKPLSDILKQFKSSASVQLLELDLKDIQEDLKKIKRYLKQRLSVCDIEKTKAMEEILSMRKSIDDYLNRLEKELYADLESKHLDMKTKMKTLRHQIKQQAIQIDQRQTEFFKMKKYANELQMYVGLREIEKSVSEARQYIDDLPTRGHLNEENIEVDISSTIKSIVQEDDQLFGKIRISSRPHTLQLKAGRRDQAQYLASNYPRMEQIKPLFMRTLKIPEKMISLEICACVVLQDGKFGILDFTGKRLLLFSNEGIFMREVRKFERNPWNMCFVKDNTVAVTLGLANRTVLVNIEVNRIIKTIEICHLCNAVASDGKTLVICSDEMATIVNLDNMSQTKLPRNGAGSIALFEGNMYSTNEKEDKIFVKTSTGEHLWSYQHPQIEHPQGITLDKNGFVYVACNRNNIIEVVSPVGKTSRTILSESDGIKCPVGINIDRESGLMIVSTVISDDRDTRSYRTAFVYKI
ncbi:unnamed protein product [Mytilus edulis]|uniref:B box-type domain-containing protein n=1 Tax=Mytilus edulis TaxID=6550 RepID=A0A8S3PS47_MYTED|nr:unnamed protein product [Mytilus edulis]